MNRKNRCVYDVYLYIYILYIYIYIVIYIYHSHLLHRQTEPIGTDFHVVDGIFHPHCEGKDFAVKQGEKSAMGRFFMIIILCTVYKS